MKMPIGQGIIEMRNTMMNKVAAVALSATMLAGTAISPAMAATNGSVGATSTGSSTITAVVGSLVRVTAVDDIDLGSWTGSGDLQAQDDVCIWTTTGGYNVTATGNGGGGSDFSLTNGSDTLTYAVKWADESSGLTALSTGAALTGQQSNATSTDCNAGANLSATVAVEITETALSGADSGSYSGVLTLVIAPE
jgi:hypothetical protein